MWVTVTATENGRYIGKLDNSPVVIKGMQAGDQVTFGPEHVVSVILPDEYQLPYGRYALVSESIVENDAWPTFLERVKEDNETDSGWRIFSSNRKESKNALVKVSVDDLLWKFTVLDSVLDEPHQQAWQWDQQHLEYRRAK
jgi:hypothetical protein